MRAPNPSNVRTYRGSCHCGAVRFEADLDLSTGTTRCNCSICTKSSLWGLRIKPAAFRLLSGEESLGDYSRSEYAHHRFCRICGIRPFAHGDIPQIAGSYVSVNLHCLDDADLAGVTIRYLDGRHDTWAEVATERYADPFAAVKDRPSP